MSSMWRCQCGHVNEPEFSMCLMCGKPKSDVAVQQKVEVLPSTSSKQDTQPKALDKQNTQPMARQNNATDTKWDARKQQANASHLGHISWKTPLKKTETAATTIAELSPADVYRVVDAIGKGNSEAVQSSMEKLVQYRPQSALAPLMKIATSSSAHEERRIVAIQALGIIGDKSVVQELIKIKKNIYWDPEKISICAAIITSLGNIGSPQAVPSLLEDQGNDNIAIKAIALQALAQISDPSTLGKLVTSVGYEFFKDDPRGGAPSFGRGFIGSALELSNLIAQASQNKHQTIRMMPLVVDQNIPLEIIAQSPAEIRRAWILKLRMWVIANICNTNNAFPQLKQIWAQANSTEKKLLIAISGVICDTESKDFWMQRVVEICQHGNKAEKSIAYSALIRLGEINLAASGLRDSDQAVIASTASSAIGFGPVLGPRAEQLYLSALPLASSNSADLRFGLVPGVLTAAIVFEEPRAVQIAKALLNDRDSDVKGFANQYKEIATENKKMLLENMMEEQKLQEQQITQTKSKPSWSSFKT